MSDPEERHHYSARERETNDRCEEEQQREAVPQRLGAGQLLADWYLEAMRRLRAEREAKRQGDDLERPEEAMIMGWSEVLADLKRCVAVAEDAQRRAEARAEDARRRAADAKDDYEQALRVATTKGCLGAAADGVLAGERCNADEGRTRPMNV